MKRSKHAGVFLAAASVAVFYGSALQANELMQRGGPSVYMTELGDGVAPKAEGGEVHVFVRLSNLSVGEFSANELLAGREIPDAATQKAHAALIDAEQAAVREQLAALGAREMSSLRAGDNGMRIVVDSSQLASIRSISGVASVAPVTIHTRDLSRSVPWIGAAKAHKANVDGRGVTIGIIDTGIDYTHANFGGSGDPNDYINNDPTIIEDGTFPTKKVVGGWDFAGAAYDAGDPLNDVPMPDPDPIDGHSHGTHVAGIAAGFGVKDSIGPGVAPKAKLYALKVFGDDGSTALTSDAIEWALDPNGDGDISDHLDIINMSLGSGFGSPDDPSAVSAATASKLGMVVVASAGNSGPIPYITGSPAVGGGAVMSVASSLSGGAVLGVETTGDVTGAHEALEGTSPVRLADGAVSADLMQVSDAANIEGCSAIADDMTGYIALISRGTCGFADKSANAEAAGAVGLIVYNDGATDERIAPIVMGGLELATIPSVMVSYFAGADLSASLGGGGSVAATMDESIMVDTLFGDTMSGFSSRGPGHGGSTFKPDMTAPGSSIVSSLFATGTEGAAFSGTSMAAPHVAGAAALILQRKPYASPEAVKAMLQNSSSVAVGAGTIGATPALARQGTGRINADTAVKLKSYASPGGVSFGRINPWHPVTVKRQVSIKSHDKTHYSVTHEPNQTFPGVTVDCPAYGHNGNVHITLTMDPAAGDYDDAFHSQTEVDGWCVFDNGHDTLRVGYMAVVDPASKMGADGGKGAVHIANKAGNLGWAEGFTLAGEGDLLNYDAPNSFRAMGFRTGSFFALGDLVEFGVASQKPWETFAAYEIDIFVDVDKDGIDDYILVAADFFGDGVPITAIFPQGAALFSTGTDLNDQSIIMTFIGAQDSPLGVFGFLPPGDYDFDYTAVFFDLRTDSIGLQFGSVDLTQEVVPAFNSFGLFPHESVDVPVSGKGDMLWLFQNNKAETGKGNRQGDIVRVKGY